MSTRESLGWDEVWEAARRAVDPDGLLEPVRIAAEHRGAYHATGPALAEPRPAAPSMSDDTRAGAASTDASHAHARDGSDADGARDATGLANA